MRRPLVTAVAAAAFAAGPLSSAASPQTASAPESTSAAASTAPPHPAIPACDASQNRCRGSLEPGTHATRLFTPPFTFTIDDGWVNGEDEDGNFLLLPPGATLAGVDAGSSDYIGVYSSVRVPVPCTEEPDMAIDATPAAMAAWFANQEALEPGEPEPVSIGGLYGIVIDVAVARASRGCGPFFPILVGSGRSSLTHAVTARQPLRLYLLASEGGTLAIEVADAENGGSVFEDWHAEAHRVVETFVFERIDHLGVVTLTDEGCDLEPMDVSARGDRVILGAVNDAPDPAIFDLVGLHQRGSYERLDAHIAAERQQALAGRPALGFPDAFAAFVASSGEVPAGASSTLLGFGYPQYGVVCIRHFEEAGEWRPSDVVGPVDGG